MKVIRDTSFRWSSNQDQGLSGHCRPLLAKRTDILVDVEGNRFGDGHKGVLTNRLHTDGFNSQFCFSSSHRNSYSRNSTQIINLDQLRILNIHQTVAQPQP